MNKPITTIHTTVLPSVFSLPKGRNHGSKHTPSQYPRNHPTSEDGKGSGVFTSDDLTAIQGEDLKALGERLGIPAQEAQLLQAAVAYLNSDDNRQNALDSAGGGNGADNIYASADIEVRLNEL